MAAASTSFCYQVQWLMRIGLGGYHLLHCLSLKNAAAQNKMAATFPHFQALLLNRLHYKLTGKLLQVIFSMDTSLLGVLQDLPTPVASPHPQTFLLFHLLFVQHPQTFLLFLLLFFNTPKPFFVFLLCSNPPKPFSFFFSLFNTPKPFSFFFFSLPNTLSCFSSLCSKPQVAITRTLTSLQSRCALQKPLCYYKHSRAEVSEVFAS